MDHQPSRPNERPRLRVFVSSPGDVAEERLIANRILGRLATEYAAVARIEAVFWEHEPLLASDTFQAQIIRPAETDIVVCILWSRLGTRLPKKITRPDGSTYDSGTEFEFEDALEGHRRHGTPDLLVYRKMAEPVVSLKDVQSARQAVEQRAKLDDFVRRFFHGDDGTLVAAFHPFENAADFEGRLEDHLHKLIEARLQRLGVTLEVGVDTIVPTWTQGCPFRGLNVFDFEHGAIFFGRTRAISDTFQQLKQQAAEGRAFLLVLGESGCGKSSVIRAGLMPLVMQPGVVEGVRFTRRAIMRSGDRSGDLFDCLATALLRSEALPELASDGTSAASLAGMLRAQPEAAPVLVKGGLSQAASHLAAAPPDAPAAGGLLVLFIDQLEELFAAENPSADERDRFFTAIRALATHGQTWVIATLRSDFYHRVAELPALVELKAGAGQYDLQPPDGAEIAQLIRRPAFAAGLRFEEDLTTGSRLDDILRDAATNDRACLPLLQFTLEELYRRRSGNVLTLAAYRDLGGIEGALARRASAEFASVSPAAQAALPSVFRHLVAVRGDAGAMATRKSAPLAVFGHAGSQASPARELVDAFIAARLFTAKQADDGVPLVELSHESLLTRWPPLVEWLRNDRELLQVRGRVATAATRWDDEGRRRELLLQPGKPLAEGVQLLQADFPLTFVETEFIAASRADSLRRQRVRGVATAALLLLSVAAIAGGLIANGMRRRAVESEAIAVRARDEARDSATRAREEERKTAAASEEARRTLVTLLLSNGDRLQSDGDLPGAALWYAKTLPLLVNHDDAAESLARRRLGVVLRQLPRPTRFSMLPFEQRRRVMRQVIAPDGRRVLCSGASQLVFGIDADTGSPLWPPLPHAALVTWTGFSPDGTRIATLAQGRQIRVWDAATGTPVTASLTATHDLAWPSSGAEGRAEMSSDNRLLAVTSTRGEGRGVEVWNIESGERLLPVLEVPSAVTAVHFSPDGTTLLVATDAEVQFRDLATGATRGEPILVAQLWDASVSPDGTRVATASGEGSAQLWDAATRAAVGAPLGHRGPVTHLAFSPDSTRLITLSADRTARLWNAADGKPVGEPLEHPERPFRARFNTDGTRVTTIDFAHTVRLWDATSGRLLSSPWRHAWEPDAAPTPTGALIAVEGRLIHQDVGRASHPGAVRVGREGSIRRIDAATGAPVLVASGTRECWLLDAATGLTRAGPLTVDSDITSVAIAEDGRWVAAGCEDGLVRLWDASGKRHEHGAIKHDGPITRVRFSRASARLLTCSADHTARVWKVPDGEPVTPALEHAGSVTDGDFSPDGTTLVTASDDGMARLWSSDDGRAIGEPRVLRPGEPKQAVTHVRFSPQGDAVLMAGGRGDLLVWSMHDAPEAARPLTLGAAMTSAEFSPDGRRVLACGYANAARVWEWRAPDSPAVSLPVATAAFQGLFHRDSTVVAVTGFDGVRLWDGTTGRPVGDRLGPMVKGLAFTADGRWLVTTDRELQWWNVEPDERPAGELLDLVRLIAMRAVDDRGSLQFLTSKQLHDLFETLSKALPNEFGGHPATAD
jgi:WD40 repeat protein